ncbi:DNA topoisomerase 3-beta-1-like isoform X2 [Varroa jacobsoni]|uniref:DNA topoisomerase 3-beta-1-like isoform X2 n=1 Tax=Varroa jacobsoni TaxID=62625 RepID=UPI000BF7C66E|nr:DNA topoisomerase 3-beta-1-like isoform X2 [Varroa jacobsoni]
MYRSVFMVAEKPSLAQSLANILSNGSCKTRKTINGACSVHEWSGSFLGSNGARFKMTAVCGHIMTTDFPCIYNHWDRVDPAELFLIPVEKKEASPKLQMPRMLAKEATNCDTVVLWLDCDKEGENICFEILDAIQGSIKRGASIFRARFSSITEKDVKAAMNNLGKPNENEARSVDARQELDLRIGCAFTRFQTKYFQNKYGNLDSSLISYGPCQTPTLGFCVERHDKIQSFKPENYWVKLPNGSIVVPEWDRGRIFDQEVACLCLTMAKVSQHAKVLSVQNNDRSKQRPLALNTIELMRAASAGLGMGPHHAMLLAEKLYMQGYISYPRTETTSYPENMDLRGTVIMLKNVNDVSSYVQQLLTQGINKPRKGTDVGDHPPITPTRAANRGDLDGESWRLYEYIVAHFLGTLSKDLKYRHLQAELQIGSEHFTLTTKKTTDPGYTAIMTWQSVSSDGADSQFNLTPGSQLEVVSIKLDDKQTSPPDYLTESELIGLMDKHGIGTDASISTHINNICQRHYVTIESGRKLKPTNLGIVLIHGYQTIDKDLCLPWMRAAVEEQLNLIATGHANFDAVLRHTLTVFQLKFHYFVATMPAMDGLLECTFSPLSASGKPISRCGKCRRYMKLVNSKPTRLHCPACDETLSLPQNGGVRMFRELKCPLDEYELLQWSGGIRCKSFIFCPYCYNHPPFRDTKKNSGCNACTHPTCPHSMMSNGICGCPECAAGVLVLDPASAPKWKIACNRCEVLVSCFEDACRVTVEEERCETCDSQVVTVEYKSLERTRLSGALQEATGCVFCDPVLTPLVEKKMALKPRIIRNRPSRPAGSKGKSKKKPKPKDKMAQLAAYFV